MITLALLGVHTVTLEGQRQAFNYAFRVETPLPAALPLFATGLGALGLLGWRRKRKAASSRLIKKFDRISERPPRGGLSVYRRLFRD